jgi:hypothetical protein
LVCLFAFSWNCLASTSLKYASTLLTPLAWMRAHSPSFKAIRKALENEIQKRLQVEEELHKKEESRISDLTFLQEKDIYD